MTEWKSIVDAPGYLVSDDGQVKRAKYTKIFIDGTRVDVEEKLLNCRSDGEYQYVCFNSKSYALHRLVANAFLEPISYKTSYIRFKDGNKSNCKASNLEWISGSDYAKQAIAEGTRKSIQPYTGIKIQCSDGEVFNSIKAAAESAKVTRAVMTRAIRNHDSINNKYYEKAK